MATAVEQIKQFYSGLSKDAKAQFLKQNNLTADLMQNWILSPKLAESLCNKYIGKNSGSTWDLYNKGKAAYATACVEYDKSKSIYNALKHKKEVAKNKFKQLASELLGKRKSGEEGLSSADKSSLALKSGYTTELIKTTKDAEIAMDSALDDRFAAVDMQRRGLMA